LGILHSKIHNSLRRARAKRALAEKRSRFLLCIWEKYAFSKKPAVTGLKTGLKKSGQKSEVAVEAEA
jgi:hypothetical protein